MRLLAWGFADHLAADKTRFCRSWAGPMRPPRPCPAEFQFRIAGTTGAEIATLLLSFGMLGLVVELFTPGFGAPALSVSVAALFFILAAIF